MTGRDSLFHDRVYDALVRLCDAPDDESVRAQWDHFWGHASDEGRGEFRFQGALGFGGKFWFQRDRWYVTCYREDETPMRKLRIAEADRALTVLRREWLDDAVGELEG